jgi:hypothetical protein
MTYDIGTALGQWETYELLERYISWREQCEAVQLAYRQWDQCEEWDHGERRLTYASYIAALDREENSARAYAEQLERGGQLAA